MSYAQNRILQNYVRNTEPCSSCAGSGRRGIIGGMPCNKCNGRGRIRTHIQLDPLSKRIPCTEMDNEIT